MCKRISYVNYYIIIGIILSIIKVETPFDITQTTWSGNINELKTLRDKLSNNSNITSLKVYIKDEQYNSWWEEVKIINKTPYVSNPNQIYALEFIASRPINSTLCVFSIVGNQYRLVKIIS